MSGAVSRDGELPGTAPVPAARLHSKTSAGHLAVFAAWASLVGVIASQHVFWRDEVRALSFATSGGDLGAMLAGLHGEGHPAVWYLVLRLAHELWASPQVLQLAAIGIGAGAVLVLLRAPFSWPAILLMCVGRPLAFEYSVSARNYGISALLLFGLAAIYKDRNVRPILIGCLLLLLTNTNIHSILLAGLYLALWLIEWLGERRDGDPWLPNSWIIAAMLASLGVAASLLTMFPTFNDAVLPPQKPAAGLVLFGLFLPSISFHTLLVDPLRDLGMGPVLTASGSAFGAHALLSGLLFASVLSLVRNRAAMLLALASLIGLSEFFLVGYAASYRHAALWLVWMISLNWIVAAGKQDAASSASPDRRARGLERLGWVAMCLILALQVPATAKLAVEALNGGAPQSRARDLADLLERNPRYARAVIMGDPDYHLETLHAYADNPTYFVREGRIGSSVRYTRQALLEITLDEILTTAALLKAKTGRPVLILLSTRVEANTRDCTIKEGFNWKLHVRSAAVRRLFAESRRIARFGPAVTDESYDVYEYIGSAAGASTQS